MSHTVCDLGGRHGIELLASRERLGTTHLSRAAAATHALIRPPPTLLKQGS